MSMNDPHKDTPVLNWGASLDEAKIAMVMIHGRGASADGILELAQAFNRPDVAYLAPQAEGYTWYPQRFIAPIAANEPHLTSAINKIGAVLAQVEAAGIPREKTILLGFSQGACLAVDYPARVGGRFGGAAALSGGLIGPDGQPLVYPHDDAKPLDGTPIFLGCDTQDFHIPKARVEESATVLRDLGAVVDMRFYPGMGHTINQDEVNAVAAMIAALD